MVRDDVRADFFPFHAPWSGAVTCRAASRGSRATPSAAGVATVATSPAAPGGDRPVALGVASAFMERLANSRRDREVGDRHRLASQGLSPILDVEEPAARRA